MGWDGVLVEQVLGHVALQNPWEGWGCGLVRGGGKWGPQDSTMALRRTAQHGASWRTVSVAQRSVATCSKQPWWTLSC